MILQHANTNVHISIERAAGQTGGDGEDVDGSREFHQQTTEQPSVCTGKTTLNIDTINTVPVPSRMLYNACLLTDMCGGTTGGAAAAGKHAPGDGAEGGWRA